MLQSVYWFCFILGGVFVAIAILGGPAELDSDADFDMDADGDLDTDLDTDGDVSVDYEIDTDAALAQNLPRRRLSLGILTSFKFWTVGSCFFGLTGLVLTWLSAAWPPQLIFLLALAMGTLIGGSLATLLRVLRRRQVDSLVRTEDFAGLVGIVELPFDASSKGKVRLEIRGSVLHLIALTDDQRSFEPGDSVLVVGAANNRLWVVSTDAADSP